jgi:hypothetical protein
VGKRTHDLMYTVNAKNRWKTICWRVNKYLKYNHLLPRFGKEQSIILYINDINDISFLETPNSHHCCSTYYYSVSGNANSMFKTDCQVEQSCQSFPFQFQPSKHYNLVPFKRNNDKLNYITQLLR